MPRNYRLKAGYHFRLVNIPKNIKGSEIKQGLSFREAMRTAFFLHNASFFIWMKCYGMFLGKWRRGHKLLDRVNNGDNLLVMCCKFSFQICNFDC